MVKDWKSWLFYSQKDLQKLLRINNNHAFAIMKNVPRYEETRPYLARGTHILEYMDKNSKIERKAFQRTLTIE